MGDKTGLAWLGDGFHFLMLYLRAAPFVKIINHHEMETVKEAFTSCSLTFCSKSCLMALGPLICTIC